jgi:hypothetical protein
VYQIFSFDNKRDTLWQINRNRLIQGIRKQMLNI